MSYYALKRGESPLVLSQKDKDYLLLEKLPLDASILFLEQILLTNSDEYSALTIRHLLVANPRLSQGRLLSLSKQLGIPLGTSPNMMSELKTDRLISALMNEFTDFKHPKKWRTEVNKLVLPDSVFKEATKARESHDLTKQDIGNIIYASRSAVSDWELLKTVPKGPFKLIYPGLTTVLNDLLLDNP